MIDWERITNLVRANKYDDLTPEEKEAFFLDIKQGAYNRRPPEKKRSWLKTMMIIFAYGVNWENLTTDQKLNEIKKKNEHDARFQSIKEMYIILEEIDEIIAQHSEDERVTFRKWWGPKN